jgi:molybdopterin/thiamine biosynthesis adenylyltransferase
MKGVKEHGTTAEESSTNRPVRWFYQTAFARNLELVSPDEQQWPRTSWVAIVGVGGVYLETLTRLGVGRFTIADPDTCDIPNINRQYGARCSTMGRPKVEVMAEIARDINPEIELRIVKDTIGPENADDFLRDANLFIDGIDFYAIAVRRLLFRKAAEKGIYGITAAPAGFGTAWVVFDPAGMPFDRYFDFSGAMDQADQAAAMAERYVNTLGHDYVVYWASSRISGTRCTPRGLPESCAKRSLETPDANGGTLCPAGCRRFRSFSACLWAEKSYSCEGVSLGLRPNAR